MLSLSPSLQSSAAYPPLHTLALMYSLLNTHHIKAPGSYLARNKFYEHTSSPSSPCICGWEEKYSRISPGGRARQQLGGNRRPLAPQRGGVREAAGWRTPRAGTAALGPASPRVTERPGTRPGDSGRPLTQRRP